MMFLHLPTPAEIKLSVVMVILKQKNKCLRDNKHLLLPKKTNEYPSTTLTNPANLFEIDKYCQVLVYMV